MMRDQAIADALSEARRTPLANGGSDWEMRAESRAIHQGPIPFKVPGRTDRIPVHVLSGAYVLPADIVSGLGEGNTLAGNAIVDRMFSGNEGPYGSMVAGRKRADGGDVSAQEAVPVMVAGGEYILGPDQVAAVGGGDLDAGHNVLDAFVKQFRADHIKRLKNLPGPVRD